MVYPYNRTPLRIKKDKNYWYINSVYKYQKTCWTNEWSRTEKHMLYHPIYLTFEKKTNLYWQKVYQWLPRARSETGKQWPVKRHKRTSPWGDCNDLYFGWMVVTRVYTFVKIHKNVHLKLVANSSWDHLDSYMWLNMIKASLGDWDWRVWRFTCLVAAQDKPPRKSYHFCSSDLARTLSWGPHQVQGRLTNAAWWLQRIRMN